MPFLWIWDCHVYVISNKLEPKLDKFVFEGYPKETKGYYFYNSFEDKVFVVRTKVFLEKEYISNPMEPVGGL